MIDGSKSGRAATLQEQEQKIPIVRCKSNSLASHAGIEVTVRGSERKLHVREQVLQVTAVGDCSESFRFYRHQPLSHWIH